MKTEKDWIDDVLQSMGGNTPAAPDPDLLSRIEAEIDSEAKVVMFNRSWISYAAAILLLVCNVTLVSQFLNNDNTADYEYSESSSESDLITDYKLYE